ncbi:sugar transferase [Anaerospora hongkongensis]|uniref:sugar transferase n=1 Tax=Anaerospora hongkongensis TaxID=244830 RepID=UPI00289A90A2|nr:sugar transferase [Anaerospora hongkongensis]
MKRRFPLVRRALLLFGDTFVIVAGFAVAVWLNSLVKTTPQLMLAAYYPLLPVMVISAWVLLAANSLLSIVRMVASQVIISVGVTVLQLWIIMMAVSFLLGTSGSRAAFFWAAVFQFIGLSIWKYSIWRLEKARLQPKHALIIGSPADRGRIARRLAGQAFSHYTISQCPLQLCEPDSAWQEAVCETDLLIITADVPLADKARLAQQAHEHGKQVALVPDFYELFCLNTELDKYDDIPVFRAKYPRPTLENRILKRGLDMVVAITSLVMLWPLFIVLAVAIKLDSRGPVFYTQIRTGRDEKPFTIYKFRTMRSDAEALTGPVLATENDPRITRLGRLMRATRLDELPQLFNVVHGEMSIVGPRPERPVFVEQLKQTIANYHYRHNVKPGITGFAQVYGKYNTLPEDKLIYDLMYIQRCSVLVDLSVMLQTVRVLLLKDSTAGVAANESKLTQGISG